MFGCFGLHEWAMVYREADQARHPVPLRLGSAGTDEVVRAGTLRCTHYDAFRFFTPDAAPRNITELTTRGPGRRRAAGLPARRDGPVQVGPFKLAPGVPSDLVAMRSSWPATPANSTCEPVPTTSPRTASHRSGSKPPRDRREYVRQQADLAGRAAPIRDRLAGIVRSWPTSVPGH